MLANNALKNVPDVQAIAKVNPEWKPALAYATHAQKHAQSVLKIAKQIQEIKCNQYRIVLKLAKLVRTNVKSMTMHPVKAVLKRAAHALKNAKKWQRKF